MKKNANLFDSAVRFWETLNSGAQTLVIGAMATAAGVGTLAGKLAAKGTAVNDADISAMGRAYAAERAASDIDYLATKLNMEFDDGKGKRTPDRKSARILNA